MALEYTGLSLDEVRADDFRDRAFHHEDVQRLLEGWQENLSGTVPFENEQRALGKDGKYQWFLIRYSPLLSANGKVVRWYATGSDIEERSSPPRNIIERLPNLKLIASTGTWKRVDSMSPPQAIMGSQ